MSFKNDNPQLQIRPFGTAFFAGIVLCVCFSLQMIPNLNRSGFPPLDNKLNPNTASVYELSQLPAVGLARAGAIVEYRQKALFADSNDLEKVKGIGSKTTDKLKPLLKFNE